MISLHNVKKSIVFQCIKLTLTWEWILPNTYITYISHGALLIVLTAIKPRVKRSLCLGGHAFVVPTYVMVISFITIHSRDVLRVYNSNIRNGILFYNNTQS